MTNGTVVPRTSLTAASVGRLYAALRESCRNEWEAYVGHEFVRRLADGSLPEAAFRRYLAQDYLFLAHFARAYGLAVYKSETLDDMRQAAAALKGVLEVEMGLHVAYCRRWDLTQVEMERVPEATATLAYTRYVLEKGASGDLLDLHVALSPCVVGYAEIGARLARDPATRREGNPYREWIEMYAGPEYQEMANAEVERLDRLAAARGVAAGDSCGRFASLARTFRDATRLEIAFWEMGLAGG